MSVRSLNKVMLIGNLTRDPNLRYTPNNTSVCSGDKVYVEGRLQTRDWKGDDGQERKTTEVVIDNMILLRSPSGASYEGGDDVDTQDMEMPEEVSEAEDVADDVPF